MLFFRVWILRNSPRCFLSGSVPRLWTLKSRCRLVLSWPASIWPSPILAQWVFYVFLQNHTFLALFRNIFFCREMYVYLPCNECKYKFYTHLHQLCSYLSLVRRITFFAVVIFHSYMSYTSQIYLYHSDFWPFFCLGRLTWSHRWNHQSELCRSHYRGETYSLLNNFWLYLYLLFMGVYMISWILHAFWLVFTKHATCTVWQGTISKFVYLFYLQLYLRK